MSETVETVAPETAAPEASASDDLRAAIAAAWDEHSGGDAPEPEAAPEVAAEAEEGPERDANGRFVGKEGEAEAPPPVEAAPPAIPPELAPVKDVLERHKPLYAARGISADQAVNALFEAQRMLETRPEESIQVLARQYGVDLSKFAPPQQQAAQPPGDPNLAALVQKVQQLEGALTAREQAAEQAERVRIETSIQQFAADPKHSHFPTVRQAMGALMQAGIANDMPTAYEMACRAHPDVYAAIQKAETEARTKADTSARTQAAAQAKAKAVSVRGSPAVSGFTKPPESLRETIEAAFAGRLN